MPGHRAQSLIPITDHQIRLVTAAQPEQFIDYELGVAALHLDPLHRPREDIGLRCLVDAVADADGGAKHLVDAFEPGGDVHAVSQCRIAQSGRRSDVADENVGAIEPDPYADS